MKPFRTLPAPGQHGRRHRWFLQVGAALFRLAAGAAGSTRAAAIAAMLLIAGATATPAQAVVYNFELKNVQYPYFGYAASWQLDSSPTPYETDAGLASFTIRSVTGSFPGAVNDVVDLIFYGDLGKGGLTINDLYGNKYLADMHGPAVFSGPISAPTFIVGTYTLIGFTDGYRNTLVISAQEPSGAVPEPATWMAMIAGFALIGAALRRKRKLSSRQRLPLLAPTR